MISIMFLSPSLVCLIGLQFVAAVIDVCTIKATLTKAIDEGKLRPTVNDWLCLICNGTQYDETKISSEQKYGLFQFKETKYCLVGSKGGLCKEDCNDFLDKNLTNDIACADMKEKSNTFAYWKTWSPDCKVSDSCPGNDGSNCDNLPNESTTMKPIGEPEPLTLTEPATMKNIGEPEPLTLIEPIPIMPVYEPEPKMPYYEPKPKMPAYDPTTRRHY